MQQPWPFDQPPNCAVISLRQIVRDGAPVLRVSHDLDDHGWQFLDGSGPVTEANAMLVAFSEVVESDLTLYSLSDLPPGWVAWRQSRSEPWKRKPSDRGEHDL